MQLAMPAGALTALTLLGRPQQPATKLSGNALLALLRNHQHLVKAYLSVDQERDRQAEV